MPLVSQTFDQLLDFTRTSSATFVGSDGLIQTTPASVNLLTYTQQFDNAAWTKTAATVTANTTVAPDGTSTADKLVETAATSAHLALQTATLQTVTYTFSAYVKAAERSIASLALDGLNAWFNLSTGALGTVEAGLTGAITAVGNGWYRCSIVRTVAVAGSKSAAIYVATTNGGVSYAGDGTSGLFIWGAQLEAAAAATTYTRNNGGVFPPRFEYDPVTLAAKGLLIEEQRTNLLVRSQEFDNASWTKGDATVTANATTSPDGTANADKLAETTANAPHYALQAVAVAATAHTASVFVKAAERTWCILEMAGTPFGCGAWFNLSTGAVGTQFGSPSSVAITAAGNGWWRITMTKTAASAASASIVVYTATGDNVSTYAGTAGSGIFLYGAQLEAGAFATSYIPTVASQVTRTADQCSIVAPNFAPWYNQSEGSFVFEGSILGDKGATTVDFLQASDGVSNSISIDLGMFGVAFPFFAVSNTTGQANLGLGTLTLNSPFKMAGAYKTNDFAGVLNGGTVQTDTSGTVPTGIAQLGLGNRLGGVYMNGHIRSVRYYPTRLSNAQIQALTA